MIRLIADELQELDPLWHRGSIHTGETSRVWGESEQTWCFMIVLCILLVMPGFRGLVQGLQFRLRSCLWFWKDRVSVQDCAFFLVTRKLASPASGGLRQDKTANLAWHIIKRSHAWHMGAARGGTVFAFNLLSIFLSILQNWKVCLICDLLSSDFQRLINNRFLNLERKIFNYHMLNNFKTAKYDCNPNVSYAFWFSLKYRW